MDPVRIDTKSMDYSIGNTKNSGINRKERDPGTLSRAKEQKYTSIVLGSLSKGRNGRTRRQVLCMSTERYIYRLGYIYAHST